MFMDRRVTIQFLRYLRNPFREIEGEEVFETRKIWAHRVDDRLTESIDVERGAVVSVNVSRRTYIIRPWNRLKQFGQQVGFASTRLVSEDGRVWWIRGVGEQGRNRLWELECEEVKLNSGIARQIEATALSLGNVELFDDSASPPFTHED